MRFTLFLIIAAFLCARAGASDSIDTLVTSLSATHGIWQNGAGISINLPKTASTEQVLDKVFKLEESIKEMETSYKILKTRQVHIDDPADLYTAVLIQTNYGERIVLLQHGKALGWWFRVYTPNGKWEF